MRQYQRIWEELKANNTAKLIAPADKHARIIKATRKEKDKDTAYKFLMLEQGKKAKLMQDIEGEVITFYLDMTTPTLYTL